MTRTTMTPELVDEMRREVYEDRPAGRPVRREALLLAARDTMRFAREHRDGGDVARCRASVATARAMVRLAREIQ